LINLSLVIKSLTGDLFMPFISKELAPTFTMHGATFTGLAAPSRGASDNAVWFVSIEPNSPGVAHSLTREEILVGLEGVGLATINDETFEIVPGTAVIVPAYAPLRISTSSDAGFRAVVVFPVGGQAMLPDRDPFTPPWAV
jgi:quercetin dioxygenase-like cupin family protein